jgi:hypothetical protein
MMSYSDRSRARKVRAEYHDAVICGAIERHETMGEAIAEMREVMPYSTDSSIKIRAYIKRRQMVEDGRIEPMHGIKTPSMVRL